ncbi:hypothetical protein [Legionella maioricensis]|uniref:Interaptin n=1 Tax=Legionella maioricensis TaxID=2896528 RepID=A0A9X2D0M8_9GAMM|nr:hypothetical protein [Legionella maioricensis]MCL9684018.1 hypothetical protein [Legionella maioricensis]MCL9687937.1 hypothetical protein [Legionella maioricensis]
MAMNLELSQALQSIYQVAQDPDLSLRAIREKMRDDALDAILRSDPGNASEFRNAIIAHKDFWYLFHSMANAKLMDQNALDNTQFLDPNDLNPQVSFQKLHQMAAEQRVRSNLYKVDNNVLIGILANNPDECRAYLAEKVEFGLLKEAKGWQPNVMVPGPTGPVPHNKSVAVLPDTTVKQIQEHASQILLSRLIATSTDKVALKQLLDATSQDQLNRAMQALGYPQSASIHITHPLTTSVPGIHNQALERETEVRQAWVKENFATYVLNLSEEDLLAKKDTLESKKQYFAEGLDEPFKSECRDLSEEEIAELRGILGARYLQVALSITGGDVLDALNASDDELEDEIDNLWGTEEDQDGGYPYIEEAVASNPALIRQGILQNLIQNLDTNPANLKILSEINSAQNLEEFKTGLGKLGITNVDWIEEEEWRAMQEWSHDQALDMVQNQILHLPNNPVNQGILKEINTAKNIEEFRAGLKKAGIDPVDWITRADKDDIQAVIRPHAFKIHLAQAQFGAEFRPELLAALDKLPPERQAALLEKPEQIRHLANAKDANAVKFYLGRDAEGIDEVVNENVRLAGFQQLHNVPIAKALEKTGFILDKSKITALNDLIETIGPNDFTSVKKYKDLVDDISEKCGIPPGNAIVYDAFGLNPTGTAYLVDNDITASIKQQREFNEELHSAALNPRDRNKELINILLRIEKTALVTDANIAKINDYFKSSKDLTTFIGKIGNDSTLKGLKAGMEHELTAIAFNQLKIQSVAAPLRGTNMTAFNTAISQMDDLVETFNKKRESFGDTAAKLQFVSDVNPVHLAAPQFIRECKDDPNGMRAKFGDMADKCDSIVDRLLRNQALLEAQLASIPKVIPRGPDEDERWEQANDLVDKIKQELEETKKSLAIFRDYQQKLSGPSGILKTIDDNIANKKNDYYEPASFKATIVKAGNTITTSPPVGAPAHRAAATIGTSSKVNNFLTGDRLGPGDKCEYEMDRPVTSGQPPTTFNAKGKFVERHDTAPPAPSKLKDGQITKQQQCTFVVEDPPHQTQPPVGPRGQLDPRLTDAKVNFYMGMAVAILSRFDPKNPPSKDNPIRLNGTSEEDMRHLWTALVIVGEKNAKNMRFGRDAIIVESGPFNPAKERGLLGFTKDSLYTKYKNDHSAAINAKVTDAQGMVKKQTDHIDSVKGAEKGIDKFKKGINEIKATVDEAEKTRAEQGPAPETPSVVFKP